MHSLRHCHITLNTQDQQQQVRYFCNNKDDLCGEPHTKNKNNRQGNKLNWPLTKMQETMSNTQSLGSQNDASDIPKGTSSNRDLAVGRSRTANRQPQDRIVAACREPLDRSQKDASTSRRTRKRSQIETWRSVVDCNNDSQEKPECLLYTRTTESSPPVASHSELPENATDCR